MEWVKLAEREPQPFRRVLVRYEVGHASHLIQYDVAWYDAGLWWLDAKHALSRLDDVVTHWAKIESPTDAVVE